jgi:hypothetical protein
MVSCEPEVSSMLISRLTDGMAIPTRMNTGMMVQAISSFVLCTMLVSATAPRDLRNLNRATIMAPKVNSAITAQIHSMIMCMP